jgi:hypothetical protein
MRSGLAEVVIPFGFRFVWGPLPTPDDLAAYLAACPQTHDPATHWSDFVSPWPQTAKKRKRLALAEFCQPYEAVELWFDPSPNDQLQLVWLLDHFHSRPETSARLKLRLVSFDLITQRGESLGKSESYVPTVDVTTEVLETARLVWQGYRAATPEACFDALGKNLSFLPLLRPALLDLIAELPSRRTGLGATEMRLLELIAIGRFHTNALFYLRGFRQGGVFRDFEIGSLLEGLAHGPRPAVAGLDDELRTLSRENLGARLEAYRRSRLSLTEFGEAVLAHQEDFSRHNPTDRWWGGTRLTNDQMWRFGPVLTKT